MGPSRMTEFVQKCFAFSLLVGTLTACAPRAPLTYNAPSSTTGRSPFDVPGTNAYSAGSDACTAGRVNSARSVQQVLASVHDVTPKGEFETTAQFQTRAAASQGSTDDISVLVPVPQDIGSYSADKGAWNFNFGLLPTGFASAQNLQSVQYVVASSIVRPTSVYTASNAFGAKTQVVKRVGTQIGLSFPGVSGFGGWPTYVGVDKPVYMTPDVAQRSRGHMAVLFVGSLVAPQLPQCHQL